MKEENKQLFIEYLECMDEEGKETVELLIQQILNNKPEE